MGGTLEFVFYIPPNSFVLNWLIGTVLFDGSRTGTLVAAVLSLILGFMGLSWASLEAGNVRSILLLASAITCGYIYQVVQFAQN